MKAATVLAGSYSREWFESLGPNPHPNFASIFEKCEAERERIALIIDNETGLGELAEAAKEILKASECREHTHKTLCMSPICVATRKLNIALSKHAPKVGGEK